jgi:hypothetical protein
MRIILKILFLLTVFSATLSAQNDFATLDRRTYAYYIRGNYRNLESATDSMLKQGIDYYYLRMRIGILSYNRQRYPDAVKHFCKALEFNSLDTISKEYIYQSYLYSGRKADAGLYLESIPADKKNTDLKSVDKPGLSEIYLGSSVTGYDVTTYTFNNLNYEAIKYSFGFQAGIESFLSSVFKGTLAFTNYNKSGTVYSPSNPAGGVLNFTQSQVYARLTGYVFPGWEFSVFGNTVFYKDDLTSGRMGAATTLRKAEYLGGTGISKTGWRLRTGVNMSFSNFSNSNQIRGEGYLTWLPAGNLNLYFTTGGMYQNDKVWGDTYQINQEVGLKIIKSIWIEAGIVQGNSFLYARNQGYTINNSFLIPATTIYSNLIFLPWKHLSLTVTPYLIENIAYSWDLNASVRTAKLNLGSAGSAVRLTYKFR